MDLDARSNSAQAGPSSQCSSWRGDAHAAQDPALQHKPSQATTRSTSSTSASSQGGYSSQASSTNMHSTHTTAYTQALPSPRTSLKPQSRRIPIYVRIVPKDIWLRIHAEPTQTIGSVKDAALISAGLPEHDPSLSHRFHQDAVTASASAKMAPVTSHDKVVKYRTFAHPKSLLCPPPDLTDVTAAIAASVAGNRERSNTLHPDSSVNLAPSILPPVSPLDASSAYSAIRGPAHDGSASPRSRRPQVPLSRSVGENSSASEDAHLTRKSNSTLATSPASAPSDVVATTSDASVSDSSEAINEIAIRLDSSLITGNRDAKAEEDEARRRLSCWSARQESLDAGGVAMQGGDSSRIQSDTSISGQVSGPDWRQDSHNSTPTIASSSAFGSDTRPSPNISASYTDPDATRDDLHATAGSPPRRPVRLNPGMLGVPASASFYTQPGASESFNSLASFSSPSSVELVTSAEDDASVMQWGTQAEQTPFSDQLSPSPSVPSTSGAGLSPLSSPLQPSGSSILASPGSASSPARPRSRTVTAADVFKLRKGKDEVPPPSLPDSVSSPTRNSSLPRLPERKMMAESSQRREVPQMDLLELLKGSPRLGMRDIEDEEGVSTVKPKSTAPLRTKASDTLTSSAGALPSPPSSAAASTESRDRYLAGIRMDEISRDSKDNTHPLSVKFAVLSTANGCELEEWKTVAAYKMRPYELLELQWAIPTERVYIPPISLDDTIRPHPNASSSSPRMFKPTWGEAADAGPDPDALCLESYFEGWVYVLKGGATVGKPDRPAKSSSKPGKWRLHWMTVKGWRVDLYRKKPRAGEAVMPVAEQVWSLRSIDWVATDADNPVPTHPALPVLATMPRCSVTVAFSPKAAGSANDGSTLTLRCTSHFDHQAVSTVLLRAWYRSSVTRSSMAAGVDNWRRKAVFRAIVAGRGGTIASGGSGARNARSRTRLRASGWPREWEDAEQWSSDSEREEVAPPAELEHLLWLQRQQARRDTVTQATAMTGKMSGQEREEERDKVVPNGLYAALLGRTTGSASAKATGSDTSSPFTTTDSSPYHQQGRGGGRTSGARHLAHSPSVPHMEPGLMLGTVGHLRSGSVPRSPEPPSILDRSRSPSRSRSLTISSPDFPSPKASVRGRATPANSSPSSRNASRDASPMPSLPSSGASSRKGSASGLSSRKGSASGSADLYTSPALVPGYVDVPPSPSLLLLKKYVAGQKGAKDEGSS